MLPQIWGHSQEFFALGKTVQTAQKLWGSTGYSGERAPMTQNARGIEECLYYTWLLPAQNHLSAPDVLVEKKVTREQSEFRNYNIN